jgi:two-component system LytT family response regulator
MKALIVDDEQFCRENLKLLLEEYCPQVSSSKVASSALEARQTILDFDPDIMFLDVRMPNESGLDLLASLQDPKMSVVFTTAHKEHALEALKAGALDYLEKPINIDELVGAVQKAERGKNLGADSFEMLRKLLSETKSGRKEEKIAIPMREGLEIISYPDILHLEASESYTLIYLSNGKRLLSSKNIKVYEEKLDPSVFFRTHKSHIINLRDHLKAFNRVDGNSAVLSDGKHIPISRRKLQEFLDCLSGL